MVKIGMTRRLEPMDRVNELGDASRSDSTSMRSFTPTTRSPRSNAAPGIRAKQRVNRVNLRRELFRVTPHEVLEVLREPRVEIVEFTEKTAAEEYRMSYIEPEIAAG